MPHVGIEYVILLPILIVQVLILPLSISWFMGVWTNDRMKSEVQETANQVASTIEQLYFSLNRTDVLLTSSKVIQASNFPKTIESYPYYAVGSMRVLPLYSRTLNLRFTLRGTGITMNSSVIFGDNVLWNTSSTFFSNSSSACIKAWLSNGMIWFSFG